MNHKKTPKKNRLNNLTLVVFGLMILSLALLVGCNTAPLPGKDITPNTLMPVEYKPMQCDISPWNEWIQESDIRFIKTPTEQEIITMYYGEYDITLTNLRIVTISNMTCDACTVCSKGYLIQTAVPNKDLQKMLDTGWTTT